MSEAEYTTCAYCPRLCRHVCPVAVATALESATPTAMMTAAWRVEVGLSGREIGLASTTLCLGCGACEAHCKVHIPVPSLLDAFRGAVSATPPNPLAGPPTLRTRPVPSHEYPLTFLSCRDGPAPSANQLACCGRRDGFAVREPAAAKAVAVENVRLFSGRSVVCDDGECAEWLRSHGAIIERSAHE